MNMTSREPEPGRTSNIGHRVVVSLAIILMTIGIPSFVLSEDGLLLDRLAALALLAVVVSGIGWHFRRMASRLPVGFGAAAVGAVCGLAIGLSRLPIVAVTVSAVVAVFGFAFAFEKVRPLIGRTAVAFAVPLIVGLYIGANVRMEMHWYANKESLLALLIVLAALAVVGVWGTRNREDPYLAAGSGGVGAFAGLAAGLSKTDVEAAVIVAILGLVGGLLAYLFSSRRETKRSFEDLLFGFGVLLIIGLYFGANLKGGVSWWGTSRSFSVFSILFIVAAGIGWVVDTSGGRPGIALGFATLGAGVGFAIGQSDVPILAAVIPSLLALCSGMILYAVSVRGAARRRIATVLGMFAVVLLLGGFLGSELRLYGSAETVVEGEQQDTPSDDGTTLSSDDQMFPVPFLALEGLLDRRVIVIVATQDFDEPLTVREPVDDDTIYSGVPEKGTLILCEGEIFEIRWSEADEEKLILTYLAELAGDAWRALIVSEDSGERLLVYPPQEEGR